MKNPYDLMKKLKMIIDRAKTVGTGFLLVQHINDDEPEKGVNIINAGSCLLLEDRDSSPVKAEAIALDKAMAACHHWIYYCNEVELLCDCEGLLGMMDKYLADIDNKKLQKILEKAANSNWKLVHIKGKHKKVYDALRRLCSQICL